METLSSVTVPVQIRVVAGLVAAGFVAEKVANAALSAYIVTGSYKLPKVKKRIVINLPEGGQVITD